MNFTRTIVLFFTLLAAPALVAQSTLFGGNSHGFGNSDVASTMSSLCGGSAFSSSKSLALNKGRTLNKYLRRASGYNGGRAFARVEGLKATAEANVRFDGDIVTGGTYVSFFGSTSRSANWNHQFDIYPTDPYVTVSVAGIPFSVGGNAGVGINVSATASASVPTVSGHGSNSSSVWIHARAWAMAGVPGFGIGVQTDLKFATAILNSQISTSPSGVSASATWMFLPLTVKIRPFVWVIGQIFGPSLINYSAPMHVQQLF